MLSPMTRMCTVGLWVTLGCTGQLSNTDPGVTGGPFPMPPAPPAMYPADGGFGAPQPDSGFGAPQPDSGANPFQDASAPTMPLAPSAGPTVLELGAATSAAFQVPPNALGIHYASADPNFDNVMARTMVDPLGRMVFQNDRSLGLTEADNYFWPTYPRTAAGLDIGVLPGTWQIQALGSTPIRVYIQHVPDGGYRGGYLDLHLHIAGGVTIDGFPLNAANAAGHPGMQARLNMFFSSTSSLLRLQRGEVNFSDAPASMATLNFDDITASEQARVVSQSALGIRGMHVLVVQDIAGDIAGYASVGANPMPGGENVVIEVSDSPERFADVLIHEMGHFVGLDHTTEVLEGYRSDPLPDTLECPRNVEHVSCPDYHNMMFPSRPEDADPSAIRVSPMQQRVFQASVIYRPLDGLAYKGSAAPAARRSSAESPAQGRSTHVCGLTLARLAGAALEGRIDASEHPLLRDLSHSALRRWQLLNRRPHHHVH